MGTALVSRVTTKSSFHGNGRRGLSYGPRGGITAEGEEVGVGSGKAADSPGGKQTAHESRENSHQIHQKVSPLTLPLVDRGYDDPPLRTNEKLQLRTKGLRGAIAGPA